MYMLLGFLALFNSILRLIVQCSISHTTYAAKLLRQKTNLVLSTSQSQSNCYFRNLVLKLSYAIPLYVSSLTNIRLNALNSDVNMKDVLKLTFRSNTFPSWSWCRSMSVVLNFPSVNAYVEPRNCGLSDLHWPTHIEALKDSMYLKLCYEPFRSLWEDQMGWKCPNLGLSVQGEKEE